MKIQTNHASVRYIETDTNGPGNKSIWSKCLYVALINEQRYMISYQAACDDDRAAGHRPQFCEHGTYMWVDYDCACAWCEQGVTRRDIAFQDARAQFTQIIQALDVVSYMQAISAVKPLRTAAFDELQRLIAGLTDEYLEARVWFQAYTDELAESSVEA